MRKTKNSSPYLQAVGFKPLTLALGLCLGLVGFVNQASAQAIDLAAIFKEAQSNDPVFAAARSQYLASLERIPQARSALMPQINFQATLNDSRTALDYKQNSPTLIDNTSTTRTTNYGVSLSQPLFRWDRLKSYEQGKLSVDVAEAQLAAARQDLVLRVSQAYFDVLAAQDALTLATAQKTAVAEQLAAAKRNFEVGTATITDTHEAQARFDLAVSGEIAAQADIINKRAALAQIIGKQPADLKPLKDKVQISGPQPAGLETWTKSAEDDNLLVVQSRIGFEISKLEIERNKAGHYPTVDLNASLGRNDSNGGATRIGTIADSRSIGVTLTIPIYSGGFTQSKVRESVALSEKSRSDLENARRSAGQAARQAYNGLNSGLAQVRALEAAEVSSRSALESNKLGYQVGVRINIDVLNAQQQLNSTQRDLARARYNTIIAGLQLKSASGQLKEEDLMQVNGLLKP